MPELISEISLGDFKKLKTSKLRQLKSCEVTSDGNYLFTFINPNTPYIRSHSEYLGNLSNTVGGKDLEDLL